MFIFCKEKNFIKYILDNWNRIEELKNDIVIAREVRYGVYKNKNKSYSKKFSDLVSTNTKIIRFIEVRWSITPKFAKQCIEAMYYNKQFYKDIELVFICTKISKKLKSDLEKYNDIKVIVLKDAKHVKGYVDKKIDLPKINDIEIKAFSYINSKLQKSNYISKCRDEILYFNFNGYIISEDRKKLTFKMKFKNNEYGLNFTFSFDRIKERYNLTYEIVNINLDKVLIKNDDKFGTGWEEKEIIYIHNFLKNIPNGYLEDKNIGDLIESILYSIKNRN